jgi:hypothetical protein
LPPGVTASHVDVMDEEVATGEPVVDLRSDDLDPRFAGGVTGVLTPAGDGVQALVRGRFCIRRRSRVFSAAAGRAHAVREPGHLGSPART